MSYSIFIWHQIILAFYRYAIYDRVTITFVIAFIAITLFASVLSFYFIENRINVNHRSFATWACLSILAIISSGWLYFHAGVSKDIPELECSIENAHRGMWGEYCDRIYKYNTDFPSPNGKLNIIVEGYSFGRDMANVILESDFSDNVNLSYIFLWEDKDYSKRVKEADYIFTLRMKYLVPDYVWQNMREGAKIYGIGTKSYGSCNGHIFVHRKSDEYFNITTLPIDGYWTVNDQLRNSWGIENYIDFMEPVRTGNSVKVFTPDKKYISQDCEHLTEAGAKYYAKLLNLNRIFN